MALALASPAALSAQTTLSPIEQLGKALFFDTNLSTPPGQACASCHAPAAGFSGPESEINAHGAVYPGAVFQRFGGRKPPSAAYCGQSPILAYDAVADTWVGGMFWDGRASGWTLGDPLAEQAQGPFLNPLEMNNPHPLEVVVKVANSAYAGLFEQVWGPGSLGPAEDAALAYERIARSIAAYERSREVSPFSSKYDAWLRGQATLTAVEEQGRLLFQGRAMCSTCHPSAPGPAGEPPLFTDLKYHNIGLPQNRENPMYSMPRPGNPGGGGFVDLGIGGFLATTGRPPLDWLGQLGKHKTPTLRNVDRRPAPGFVKAYGHNGVLKSLEDVVGFYNTRDYPGATWGRAEVPLNLNMTEVGNLGLTPAEEAAVVAFLKTLTDGWQP